MARILVIDDSVSILEWMKRILSALGHRVSISSSGQQGILTLRGAPFDLVITDIYMPEKDGLEVIQFARRLAPHARLVAMSVRPAGKNLFGAALALGAVATLQKPFSEAQLAKTVAEALRSPSDCGADIRQLTGENSPCPIDAEGAAATRTA